MRYTKYKIRKRAELSLKKKASNTQKAPILRKAKKKTKQQQKTTKSSVTEDLNDERFKVSCPIYHEHLPHDK